MCVEKIQNETKTEKWATTRSGTRTHDLLLLPNVRAGVAQLRGAPNLLA